MKRAMFLMFVVSLCGGCGLLGEPEPDDATCDDCVDSVDIENFDVRLVDTECSNPGGNGTRCVATYDATFRLEVRGEVVLERFTFAKFTLNGQSISVTDFECDDAFLANRVLELTVAYDELENKISLTSCNGEELRYETSEPLELGGYSSTTQVTFELEGLYNDGSQWSSTATAQSVDRTSN